MDVLIPFKKSSDIFSGTCRYRCYSNTVFFLVKNYIAYLLRTNPPQTQFFQDTILFNVLMNLVYYALNNVNIYNL